MLVTIIIYFLLYVFKMLTWVLKLLKYWLIVIEIIWFDFKVNLYNSKINNINNLSFFHFNYIKLYFSFVQAKKYYLTEVFN